MKRLFFLILTLVFGIFGRDKERVSISIVPQVVNSHLLALGKEKFQIKNVEVLKYSLLPDTLAYIVNLSPQGFIVVSPDKNLPPVIAYSFLSNFPYEESRLNILLDILRKDMELRLKHLDAIPDSVKERHKREWRDYLKNPLNIRKMYSLGGQWPPEGSTSTGGWVETTWHQRSPYNDSCPIDYITGDRCVTGCVATAMAQIVNYWEYPHSLHFDDSDNYLSNAFFVIPPRQIYIDCVPDGHNDGVAEHEYEHNPSMDNIDYGNGNSRLWAQLNFACGVAVHMMYSSMASGAYHTTTAQAYKSKFGYESATYMVESNSDFYPTLKDNMKNAQPAQLGIFGYLGGHSIVCDGLKEIDGSDDQYHLNFGWGPSNPRPITECWYVLPDDLPPGLNNVEDGILDIKAPEAPKPHADFATLNSTTGCAPYTVHFVDRSKGIVTSWFWEFGDGQTSTERNPTHTYRSPGEYTVSLLVSDGTYSDKKIKPNYIKILGPPEASFSASPRVGPPPLTVRFKDNSSGEVKSWLWDFGDGVTSSFPNPTHTYTKQGTYTVSLKVSNDCGEDIKIVNGYIVVGEILAANFTASPISGCSPLKVQFKDGSIGKPTSWLWDFGDGTTSTEQNPIHIYEEGGRYTVSLTVKREDFMNTIKRDEYIHVYTTPKADFTADRTKGYEPLIHHFTVKFFDTSTGNPTSWLWDFGDGSTSTEQNPIHTYKKKGKYTVKLQVKGEFECSDEVVKEDFIEVSDIPLQFALYTVTQEKPMVFYDIPKTSPVRIEMYSTTGRHIMTIENTVKTPGRYYLNIEKLCIPKGVYFVKLHASNFVDVKKVVIY